MWQTAFLAIVRKSHQRAFQLHFFVPAVVGNTQGFPTWSCIYSYKKKEGNFAEVMKWLLLP